MVKEKNITLLSMCRNNSGNKRVSHLSVAELIARIKDVDSGMYIVEYRDMTRYMNDGTGCTALLERIPELCLSTEYCWSRRTRSMKYVAYNGIVLIEVDKLNGSIEARQVKRKAELLPQTLMAMMGCDAKSVVIVTLATLPDGEVPKEEKDAELFHAEAYRVAVQCYAPTLPYQIRIREPRLDTTVKMTADADMYVNQYPTPFVIEQPTVRTIARRQEAEADGNPLMRISHDGEGLITFRHLFNSAYRQTLLEVPEGEATRTPMNVIPLLARHCAELMMPEEEAVTQIWWHFRHEDVNVIRGTVHNVYMSYTGNGVKLTMPKKQVVAIELAEFVKRRYDVRYNEMLDGVEYRERNSFNFMYRGLGKRDVNTIRHEAALEGIEAFDSEVSGYLNSRHIANYNPVDAYLEALPKWDGKDRIREVARMVTCENVHWEDLFYRWFVSMVAQWMNIDHEHGNSTAPILIGGQGYRKSTFCRILLPPELRNYYTDSLNFSNKTEAERCLCRFLLINIDEFDQLSEGQFAFVKHLFQKPVVNLRRSYSNAIDSMRRYASFIGTSNHDEILRDPTGSRRYLCIEVTAPIRTDTPINYLQLYAQAYHVISSRERYWLNDEEEGWIKEANKRFEIQTPLEQMLLDMFRLPDNDENEWYRTVDIMDVLRSRRGFTKQMDSMAALGKILTKLHVEKRRRKNGYHYRLSKI